MIWLGVKEKLLAVTVKVLTAPAAGVGVLVTVGEMLAVPVGLADGLTLALTEGEALTLGVASGELPLCIHKITAKTTIITAEISIFFIPHLSSIWLGYVPLIVREDTRANPRLIK